MNKRKSKFETIRYIILIEILTIICFTLLTGTLLYHSISYTSSQEREYMENRIENASEVLENQLIVFSEISNGIITSNDATLLKGYYFDKTDDEYGKSKALNSVRDSIIFFQSFYSLIDGISLSFKPEGDFSYDNLYSFDADYNKKALLDKSLQNETESNSISESLKFYDNELFFVFNPHDSAIRLSILLNKDVLLNDFSITNDDKDKSYIVERDDQFLLVNSNFDFDSSLVDGFTKEIMDDTKVDSRFEFFTYRIILDKIPFLSVRYSPLYTGVGKTLLILMIVSIVAVVLLGSFFIYFTVTYVNKPIHRVVRAMELVSKGDMNVQIEQKTKGDLQLINEGFNNMVSSLNGYIEENYLYKARITESEFKMLQSQINPHFLYNCFANISSLCRCNQTKEASLFTAKLSSFYMYLTRNEETNVSLIDEYKHMSLYLDIQTVRFQDRVKIEKDELKEELQSIRVPKLILQPIVENSYKYVFSNVSKEARLNIRLRDDENYVYLNIEDSGDRKGELNIDEINKMMTESVTDHDGLSNVYHRLDYFSKGKSKMRVYKSSLGGLGVELQLAR